MSAVKIAALSVDLDEIPHYERIYGLPAVTRAARLVYDVGLTRMRGFAERLRLPLTLFAVGDDAADARCASALRRAVSEGHVVESHSMRHAYDLVQRSPVDVAADVRESFDAIERAVGRRPRGFRAPGYLVSEPLFDALESVGASFDASVLPSAPYFAAKLAVLAATRVRGRTSASLPRGLSQALAPRTPYRPGRSPLARGLRPFVELPISTVGGLPIIGTTIPRLPRRLVALAARADFVNVELHGIDFLRKSDGLDHVAERGPELGLPLGERLAAYHALCDDLRAAGFTFVTLAEAAERYSAEL